MKKITLTADETLIKRAQAKARTEKTTLTAEFRRWLEEYTATAPVGEQTTTSKAKPGITLAGCVDALKRFEKKLEEKL